MFSHFKSIVFIKILALFDDICLLLIEISSAAFQV